VAGGAEFAAVSRKTGGSLRLRLHSGVTRANKGRSLGARFFGRVEGSFGAGLFGTAEAVPLRGFGGGLTETVPSGADGGRLRVAG
jgi:hypothetical protein